MAKVARPFRLGGGEVDYVTSDRVRWDARRRFLNAVRDHKPVVVDTLATEPFITYVAAMKVLGRPAMPRSWDALTTYADDEEFEEFSTPLAPVRNALDRWARRWNLREPWCLMTVMDTLDTWARVPAWCEARAWATAYGGFLPVRREERLFRFEHEGWEPSSDTRRQAEAGIRRAFERELAAYLDQVYVTATERGFTPTPEKRSGDGFTWLARVVVDEASCGEIARELGLARRTVEKAVDDVARIVGIPVSHRPN